MKRLMALAMGATLLLACPALAETGTAYGIYSMEGDMADSLIRVTLTVEEGKVTEAAIDEKLLPATVSGAAGWAELDEETAALLGDAVLEANAKTYPAAFSVNDVAWTGAVGGEMGVTYTAQIDGSETTIMDYILTDAGAQWYFAQENAALLNAEGEQAAQIAIGTKESTEHGVAFWPSELKFPGNIANIEAFLVENGVQYAMNDVAKNDDGVWAVADAVTGATLAGTPNYLLIAQKAYANAR